jgi:maltooligosyltrehalose synthase
MTPFVKLIKIILLQNYSLELLRRLKSCDYIQEKSTTHHDRCNESKFPIQVDNESGHPETIKWTIEKEKYKIHQTILEKVEIGDILTHCLQVVHKIKTKVGNNEKKLIKSYMQVLLHISLKRTVLTTIETTC